MPYPLTILYTPLPQGSIAELRLWRCAFEAALEPWLDARQQEHVRRFGREATGGEVVGQEVTEAALSRLMARTLLITAAATHHKDEKDGQLPKITMDSRGRPQLEGWRATFSHSGRAAFCALAPAGHDDPALGLDAEALTATPPHTSAFAAHELAVPPALPQKYADRETLRRWTIKEALLKAAGLGLGIRPAQVPTGRHGQRAGLWQGPLGPLGWRTFACPGHWLCVALAGHIPPVHITLLRQSPRTLLHRLANLPPHP